MLSLEKERGKVSPSLLLTLSSELSGIVGEVGSGVTGLSPRAIKSLGLRIPDFAGAQAEFTVAIACMIAQKPQRLSPVEAASVPVVAVTARRRAGHVSILRGGVLFLVQTPFLPLH